MIKANPVYRIIAVRTLQASALGWTAHWLLHWPLIGPHALGLFLTPALSLYFVFVFVGPLTWGLPILSRLPGGHNTVALTFDDGPSPATTWLILDILRAQSVSATFFVLGDAAAKHPEIVQRIVAEGHAIGIHGFRHEPFVLLSARAVRRELALTEAAIRAACPDAVIVPWVRPPHGFKSLSLIWTLRRAGYGLAAWSVNSRDYADGDAGAVANRVVAESQAGSVILLHDGPSSTVTVQALRLILAGLEDRGLTPVKLENWVSSSY